MRPQDLRDLAFDRGREDYAEGVCRSAQEGAFLEPHYLVGWKEAEREDFIRRSIAERKSIHYPVAQEVAS